METETPAETETQPKSAGELKAERLTWFGLVGIFIVLSVIPEWVALHNALIPLAGGLVLLTSGLYQYRQKWRVGFFTWVAATLMLVMAIYSIFDRPDLDLSFVVIVLVVIVIALGVFTNET